MAVNPATTHRSDYPGLDTATALRLADRHDTPFLVLDLRRIRANIDRITSALHEWLGPASRPSFALKSCYVPDVLATVRGAGWEVEVMSGFELDLALRAGVPGHELTLTGLGWGADTCRTALAAGVHQFLVDTDADLHHLADAAQALGATAEVFLRLNLGDQLPESFLGPDAKLGWGTANLLDRLSIVRSRPGLTFAGLHLHQFNRLTEPDPYHDALTRLAALRHRLHTAGVDCPRIDLGGGLESLARLDLAGAPIEQFASIIGRHFGPGTGVTELITEFGRAVVADAGYAVGRVTAAKTADGRHWAILDVPTNSLVPIPGAVFPPVSLADPAGRPLLDCSFSDGTGSPVSFAEHVPWPAPQVGDLLCLTEAGAYTTVFTELWAAPLPTLVVIGEDGTTVVRDGPLATRTTFETWYGPQAWRAEPATRVGANSDGSARP